MTDSTDPAFDRALADVLADARALRDPQGDPQLEALRVAVLLEDVFGAVLTDAELDPAAIDAVLADPEAARRLLRERAVPGRTRWEARG